MMRRLPILPTLVVLAAAGIMIALGFWQLGRDKEKRALVAHYAAIENQAAPVPFPLTPDAARKDLYRRSQVDCIRVFDQRGIAGRSRSGQHGFAQTVRCALAGGGEATVALGFTDRPEEVSWSGGNVAGILAPNGHEARLVADPPVAGLAPLARPDPKDIPNNSLSYAVQWFLFAATALVIYALALRKRWRSSS